MEEIFPHEYIRVCVRENNYVDFILGNLVYDIYCICSISWSYINKGDATEFLYIAHNLDFTAY